MTEGKMKSKKLYRLLILFLTVFMVLVTIFVLVFYVLIPREVAKVSIFTYSVPSELGDVIFVRKNPIFVDTYFAVDLTPGNYGDEFVVGHIDCGDGIQCVGIEISKDGTLIACRTTIGSVKLSDEQQGGQFPYTHAYDFSKKKVIAPLKGEKQDDNAPAWNDRAVKILELMQQRGGPVEIFEWLEDMDFKRLSYSESQRWRMLISEVDHL